MITDFKLYENNNNLVEEIFKSIRDNETTENIISLIGDNDVNDFQNDRKNLLIVAIEHNKLDLVDYLIDKGIDLNYTDLRTNKTAIFYSCEKGFQGVSKKLIDKGIDLNSQDKYGNTAIMRNLTFHYCEILFDLMIQKTDWSLKDIYGNDLFQFLTEDEKEKLIKKYPQKWNEYIRNKNLNKYGI